MSEADTIISRFHKELNDNLNENIAKIQEHYFSKIEKSSTFSIWKGLKVNGFKDFFGIAYVKDPRGDDI